MKYGRRVALSLKIATNAHHSFMEMIYTPRNIQAKIYTCIIRSQDVTHCIYIHFPSKTSTVKNTEKRIIYTNALFFITRNNLKNYNIFVFPLYHSSNTPEQIMTIPPTDSMSVNVSSKSNIPQIATITGTTIDIILRYDEEL